jgi:DNA polymerase-1
MAYMIFDLETETHQAHKRKANQWHPENYVVDRGWKVEGDAQCSMATYPGKTPDNKLHIPDNVDVIVGHNIKFDLLYEMVADYENLADFFRRGGRAWCTQYAHYLLNAQDRKTHMNSMDQIIEQYGGRKKIDGMKELWAAGVQTSDIDPAMRADYLIGTEEEGRNSGDIGNTELIYLGQIAEAEANGMLQMIKVRMDGLCATTEMEYNGIKVDVERGKKDLQRLTEDLRVATEELTEYTAHIPPEVGFKWSSGPNKSCLIYGGTVRYQVQTTYLDEATGELARKKEVEKQPVLKDGEPVFYLSGKKKGEQKFKNVPVPGELKVKYQDFFFECPGYVDPKVLELKAGSLKDGRGGPIYSTDSDTLELLGNLDVPFLKAMGRKTALDKEIGTYYVSADAGGNLKGMFTCIQPTDHIIHHQLNHTSTVTARLSASNPNMQNIPRGDKSCVKAMFVSRFPDGVMGEIDYSQLEVVVTGVLTADPALIADLNKKVDFHCVRVAAREGCTYEEAVEWCKNEDHIKNAVWSVFRTECKTFSFQRAYGAGASTIAISANMTVEQVKSMIKVEQEMYPGVETYHARVEAEANATAEPYRDPARGFRVFRRGTYQAPTGTLYAWNSYDAPKFLKDRGIDDQFSQPEIKNYPTQGTGGEIMQMTLGVLWRYFNKTRNFGGKALMVNTVHDCAWFDMHKDVVDEVMGVSKRIMEAVPQLLKHFFNINCPVQFPTDAEVGPNMLELKHWHPA